MISRSDGFPERVNPLPLDAQTMEVTILGTGAAIPSAERVQSGTLLARDDRTLLVDCGSGTLHRLAQAGIDHTTIDTVLLTHHHLDHVCDLPGLLKARVLDGHPSLTIHGPPGTRGVCDHLFSIDDIGRRADCSIVEHTHEDLTLRVQEIPIEGAQTTHSKPCFAYRFDDVLSISGDTAPNAEVFALADGVDTLIHECSFPDGTHTDGHSTPTALGRGLADIDVERVFLTHIFPIAESEREEMAATVGTFTDASVAVATDLERIHIPA